MGSAALFSTNTNIVRRMANDANNNGISGWLQGTWTPPSSKGRSKVRIVRHRRKEPLKSTRRNRLKESFLCVDVLLGSALGLAGSGKYNAHRTIAKPIIGTCQKNDLGQRGWMGQTTSSHEHEGR